jgi:hypothetical protein
LIESSAAIDFLSAQHDVGRITYLSFFPRRYIVDGGWEDCYRVG